MVRFGWVLITVGLTAAAWIAFQFYLALVVDPTLNAPFWGFFMISGFGVGVSLAVAGAVIIAKSRGIWIPPI
jgi:hypothetical protein